MGSNSAPLLLGSVEDRGTEPNGIYNRRSRYTALWQLTGNMQIQTDEPKVLVIPLMPVKQRDERSLSSAQGRKMACGIRITAS